MHFLYGFVSEYPWGAAFDFRDVEERQNLPTFAAGDLPVSAVPAWSEVVSEWEYDVSRADVTTLVPARQLLGDDLWWDGDGGFATPNGKVAFVDPSFRGTGSPAALADAALLDERLQAAELSLVVTMTGEKRVQAPGLGEQPDLPRLSFSQVGFLNGRTERFSRPVFVVE